MRTQSILSSLLVVAVLAPGCAGMVRDAETYRADTRALLETQNTAVKSCYDAALVDNPELDGEVVVRFHVEKKTGKLRDVAVDPEQTKAPPALSGCIVQAIEGLTLEPVDRREGVASYRWTFKANPPVQL